MSSQQENPTTAHVVLETTAGEARAEAPTAKVAEQIEKNVDRTHTAAGHAAKVAKVKGPELTGESIPAVERLQAGASNVTTDAVVEGERDVENAKAAGASYLEQAKALASSAIATAQSYLPESLGGQTTSSDISPHTKPEFNKTAPDSISSTLQSGVNSAIETTKQYAVAAQETIQSQVESAKGAAGTAKQYVGTAQETVKAQVERAKGTAQGLMGTTGTQGAQLTDVDSAGVPAISAPLESGRHVVGNTTYPPTGSAKKIAANEPGAP
ncbi:hypothetical protein M378DRAFT_238202 [Amanita muscaria Koide BX008]|uniref:Uncharacterized protein n=1 Tax=Amanita muscaria (strain Koide BX008) TaxID=946122 RepID=A0A0C2XR35_AMAMK|nr:hypothetical protein M378DRAFT_238202 [Amanita muscaria Koide BX008]